jgi:hypothetical protein
VSRKAEREKSREETRGPQSAKQEQSAEWETRKSLATLRRFGRQSLPENFFQTHGLLKQHGEHAARARNGDQESRAAMNMNPTETHESSGVQLLSPSVVVPS